MNPLSQPPKAKATSTATLSVLVLIRRWSLAEDYQAQLIALARVAVVHELILVGKQVQELPLLLAGEAKLRSYQLHSDSLPLRAEAAAFEAGAEVLVMLELDVILPLQALQAIPQTIEDGCYFGGLIRAHSRWWWGFLKRATISCKGLFWFRLIQGYFVSRKVYHHSGDLATFERTVS
jgi:hypothetical protein